MWEATSARNAWNCFVCFWCRQCSICRLGKPWSVVPASVGACSRARGRGRGSDAGVYAYTLELRVLHFIFASKHLEFATRRRPPRASRRGLRAGPPD